MPISQADITAAIGAGLTRAVTYSLSAPTGGDNGDWWLPGPSTAPGVYYRTAGAWTRVAAIRTPAEIVTALMGLTSAARLDASAIKNIPTNQGGGWSSPTTANVTFADATFQAHAAVVPATASLVQVAFRTPVALRGTYFCNGDVFRALGVSNAGDAPADTTRARLAHFGLVGSLWIGRTSANVVLLGYDGGHANLGAGTVEVLTH